MRNDFDIKTLIGLTEEKANELAGWNGFSTRVTMRDGEHYFVTMDLRMNRVNLSIEEGLVTEVKIG